VGGAVVYSPARWLRVEGTVGTALIENLDHVVAPSVTETPFRISGNVVW
jgi:hypothetical protein